MCWDSNSRPLDCGYLTIIGDSWYFRLVSDPQRSQWNEKQFIKARSDMHNFVGRPRI